MNRYLSLLFVCLILFTLSLPGCIKENEEEYEGGNISVNDKLPSLSLALSDGTDINDEALNGKISVILLFTTSCKDCRQQLPIIERLYKNYFENDNIVIIGISRSEGEKSIYDYWQANNLTFPFSPQNDRLVYSLFASSGVPRIYISDRSRTVKAVFDDNPVASYEKLSSAIDNLLKQ